MTPLALLQLRGFFGEVDALTGQLLHGLCVLGLLMVVFLGFRAFVDSRINRVQLHLTQALARYMQDADAKRQQLEAHAERLLEQHIGAVLTPQEATTLLDDLKTQLSGSMDTAAGATVDRCMKMIPEYVKTNLVHGIHYVLQAQTNPDDGSILTNMRKMYLALQPTRILAQNAQQGVPQSALDDMQGSLQLWLESQIVQKVDAVIDLLAKVQVELSAFNDTSGANHTARVSADLEKIIAYIEQLFERHESHKDRAMEASSQSHALMNHVKQTNGLANSCLNQVNQVSNSQWTHSDQLAGLQEGLREQDDKLKKQSDALSKVQGQLEKVILKLTPAMPTKAPPPPAPGTSTPPSGASSSTPTPPAPQVPAQAQTSTPVHPAGPPQACSPPHVGTDPPVIRLSDQMGPRQPLQLFDSLNVPARRFLIATAPARLREWTKGTVYLVVQMLSDGGNNKSVPSPSAEEMSTGS
ncbi:hypothetical protein AK812_SmicGene24092 [Symbiodinium microadriaticum]|uniref:Uncharacterized protein n=1 Tax=Symbiodinium microadriaticum TaxID=2951 RepID=A0A1Q9DFF8_SYMMI|nr:hypothetical protein AK812_SmicGene24092 [Symbiodinium microadriaticum]